MHCIVTGGAGFIGSHLVDLLLSRGDSVTVIDSMVAGRMMNLEHNLGSLTAFRHADLLDDGWQDLFAGADRVYHIAADPDVRGSARKSYEVYNNNVTATVRVLEAMKEHGVPEIVFTSTSTVYGEADVIPTPETYAPMIPISVYGASKLACEAMISAYAATYGMKAWVYRFANIIGSRSTHGVIYDFVRKLQNDPAQLEILGDGRQSKSYLAVENCVAAMVYAPTVSDGTFNVFNIGSEDWVSVKRIAELIVEEMDLKNVSFHFTGGDRGWVGDVPMMRLSVEKLKATGWEPGITSEESVRRAIRATLEE
ncbi:NAD-dependent epimerase/dehydratase family protein [Methanocorpusculum sp. MG]|uniref:NAD-dependent epimerase/dehydratase family protein n=1 Tax=Methanocorpusculum petauri TaxID=3002863 RepID=A0ABT4ID56_9EURY|nr:NAD-dependent epimerase/dehydratase family protein [Methanocorpusculum petauri]MCZ0859676.1 NAD-dependent epimerase/dehydratase family protein [Methanocorpusculum petauri]